MNIDQANLNNGTLDNNGLRFGSGGSGEGITSARTGGSNNQYGLDFYTGALKRMVITLAGNVGIGVTVPENNLSVKNGMNIDQGNANNGTLDNNILRFGGGGSGEAISSGRTNGSNNQYGLDFYTSNLKRMVISNTGNVGIGLTSPTFILDVSNRMRIRSGGDITNTAGLWLNTMDNLNLQAFIGAENDNYVGFYGAQGAGFKFVMNTQTGALKINGSEGVSGQVLKSNGGSAPTWVSPTNSLYNSTVQVTGSSVSILQDDIWTAIPGLTNTFSTVGNTKALIMFNVHLSPALCVGCVATSCRVGVFVDGVFNFDVSQDVTNNSFSHISGTFLAQLGAGTHTIDIRGKKNGPGAFFYGQNMIRQNIAE